MKWSLTFALGLLQLSAWAQPDVYGPGTGGGGGATNGIQMSNGHGTNTALQNPTLTGATITSGTITANGIGLTNLFFAYSNDQFVFDPKLFGAQGDGVVNDFTAVQNCWNAAVHNNTNGYSTRVVMPAKYFLGTNTLNISGPLMVEGNYVMMRGKNGNPSNRYTNANLIWTNGVFNGIQADPNNVIDGTSLKGLCLAGPPSYGNTAINFQFVNQPQLVGQNITLDQIEINGFSTGVTATNTDELNINKVLVNLATNGVALSGGLSQACHFHELLGGFCYGTTLVADNNCWLDCDSCDFAANGDVTNVIVQGFSVVVCRNQNLEKGGLAKSPNFYIQSGGFVNYMSGRVTSSGIMAHLEGNGQIAIGPTAGLTADSKGISIENNDYNFVPFTASSMLQAVVATREPFQAVGVTNQQFGVTNFISGSVNETGIFLADDTINDVSTSMHGFQPKLNGNPTTFMSGSGAYSSPFTASNVVNVSGQIMNYGNLNLNKLNQLWGKMFTTGNLKAMHLGDSIGGDVWSAAGRYFEGRIGINGTGIGVNGPGCGLSPWSIATTVGAAFSTNTSGTGDTNWYPIHPFVSNTAAVYCNRLGQYDISSGTIMPTNVLADTATFIWINRTNGSQANLEVGTNNVFYTLASVNSGATTPSLGFTNISLPLNSYTWRITATGGGDGAFELVGGGLTIATNTTGTGNGTNSNGLLLWAASAPGKDYSAFVSANSNILNQFFSNAAPDVVTFSSLHTTPLPYYVYNLVSNAVTNAQFIIASQHNAVTYGSNAILALLTNDFALAISNNLPFVDVYSYLNDTNVNYKYGFQNGTTEPHLTGPGISYKGWVFWRALGFDIIFSDANSGGPGGLSTPILDGTRAGLFNTDSKQQVGVGTPAPLGKFAVQLPGSMFSVDQGTQYGAHTMMLMGFDSAATSQAGTAIGQFDHSNALFFADVEPNGYSYISNPYGGDFSIGVLNGFGFQNVNDYQRFLVRKSGAVMIGTHDHDYFDYPNHALDIGAGTLDVQNSINLFGYSLQITNSPGAVGGTGIIIWGSNSISSVTLASNGMMCMFPSNGFMFGEVWTNGAAKVFKIGP